MQYLRLGLCALVLTTSVAAQATADSTMPSCGPGDSVVWENTSTKVYHAQGDAYYGKTKHGQYACKSDADKAGFHLSKSKSKGAASAATASPTDDASPSAGKHHRHKSGTLASPAPGASPDAAASPAPAPTSSGKHHHRKKGATPSPVPSAT